jgi:hypothetical protein
MQSSQQLALVTRIRDEFYNAHQPDALLHYLTDDFSFRGGSLGTISGAEKLHCSDERVFHRDSRRKND